jgi:putative CocE/NonD family hydrolase
MRYKPHSREVIIGTEEIKVIENIFIPMPDECRLAAKIWLPLNSSEVKVPAILEYLPYRKRDGTAIRDQLTHPYLAKHGYACLRVDMRGSGESDGILMDEYLKQEQEDCIEVLRWIAKQSWSTGKVGMMGISWGGFNSLQVAALNPPELQAVISICSTDDRYNDDIHFMGGCLLTDSFEWSSTMLAMMSRAPDVQIVGNNWRDIWLNRLEHQPLFATEWLTHPLRDKYWKQGSICENWKDIHCPVYLVGGWADGYSNTIPRMLANLSCPRKGLIGPWAHKYPHFGKPGPQIGFLQESLRWWDKWLKGIETNVMNEAIYRVWMQESISPQPYYDVRPGRWIAEPHWPNQDIQHKKLFLTEIALSTDKQDHAITASSPQSVGEASGAWCGYGMGPEKPLDQRSDDGRSICFEMKPLTERLEILGAPLIDLDLSVDKPDAFIAVRLNEVAPDGASTRISYGLLNLAQRVSQEKLTPIIPNERVHVRFKLNDIAHAFSAENRLRIAISTTYWPLVWPSPEKVHLSIFAKNSYLTLPVRIPRELDTLLPPFQKAESAPPLSTTYSRPSSGNRYVERDLNGGVTYRVIEDSGHMMMNDIKLEVDYIQKENFYICDDDPLSATINIQTVIALGRDQCQTRTEIKSNMKANKVEYLLEAQVDAYENNELIFTRQWQDTVPRHNGPMKSLQRMHNFFKPKLHPNEAEPIKDTLRLVN